MTTQRRARHLLGTIVDIRAEGRNASQAIDAAFQEIETVHCLMSFHETDSDVSRLNRAPLNTPISIDHRTYEVLACAEAFSIISNGLFDVTVAGALVTAGFLPSPQPERPKAGTSFRELRLLSGNQVMRLNPIWVDLGGIAKGYAVDRAVDILRSYNIENGSVNAGGDLCVFGAPQAVHIRDPLNEGRYFLLEAVENTAVASSSGDRRGGSYAIDPLVSPHNNTCLEWGYGVTVIASNCMTADPLTKIVRLMPENILEILSRYNAIAMRIDSNGLQRLSPNPSVSEAA